MNNTKKIFVADSTKNVLSIMKLVIFKYNNYNVKFKILRSIVCYYVENKLRNILTSFEYISVVVTLPNLSCVIVLNLASARILIIIKFITLKSFFVHSTTAFGYVISNVIYIIVVLLVSFLASHV